MRLSALNNTIALKNRGRDSENMAEAGGLLQKSRNSFNLSFKDKSVNFVPEIVGIQIARLLSQTDSTNFISLRNKSLNVSPSNELRASNKRRYTSLRSKSDDSASAVCLSNSSNLFIAS